MIRAGLYAAAMGHLMRTKLEGIFQLPVEGGEVGVDRKTARSRVGSLAALPRHLLSDQAMFL